MSSKCKLQCEGCTNVAVENPLFQKNGRKADTQTVVETLYKNKSSLEAIFKILDKDNSGQYAYTYKYVLQWTMSFYIRDVPMLCLCMYVVFCSYTLSELKLV